MNTQFGISGLIWIGRVYERGAWGDVSRNHILGLKKIGFPVRVYPVGSIQYDVKKEVDHFIERLLRMDVGSYPAVIIDKGLEFVHYVKTDQMVKIGRALFETDRLPASMVADSHLYDEIWVPSQFNLETFSRSGVSRDKLRVVPYGVDTEIYKPRSGQYPIPERRRFVILTVFGLSWKKGFDLLLEAYFREFTINDDVTLVMKVLTSGDNTAKHHNTRQLIFDSVADRIDLKRQNIPHCVIIDELLTRNHVLDLYATCDLHISTDRGAGWGMALMEAMAMGKPAAAINYGGGTEFMNCTNSLLIATTGRLVPVDPRFVAQAPVFAGHQWGEVRVEEVQRVLRYAYEHPEELKQIAERGMKDVCENYSLEAVARRVVVALSEIPPISGKLVGKPKLRFKKAYGVIFRLRLVYHRLKYWYRSKTMIFRDKSEEKT